MLFGGWRCCRTHLTFALAPYWLDRIPALRDHAFCQPENPPLRSRLQLHQTTDSGHHKAMPQAQIPYNGGMLAGREYQSRAIRAHAIRRLATPSRAKPKPAPPTAAPGEHASCIPATRTHQITRIAPISDNAPNANCRPMDNVLPATVPVPLTISGSAHTCSCFKTSSGHRKAMPQAQIP